ncbi:unnamed protein product [Adineta steineri]|uniref:Uncharacterized protein n=1 Tax=Adineta steineri TaxID=433720 RepID=A0A818R8F0_9BILA|nr:unnamed protein product [Adineta steineri]CAF3524682.1 unnamed protein product [Adineta steineri]CAF3647540.1 unnamed protein product [Adineta steineri]
MLGTVMKHGVDVQAAKMRRQEAVKRRAPPRVMERILQPISVNAQENGVAAINRGVSHLDWANEQPYKRHLEVNLKELLKK